MARGTLGGVFVVVGTSGQGVWSVWHLKMYLKMQNCHHKSYT